MRKRSLLAVLLVLCMVVMLMPAAAFAEDENGAAGIKDIPGGSGVTINTTVRDNYTDRDITDDIDLMAGEDYIIDFTKEDNLSCALKALAGSKGTRYYKFENSDNKTLVETENQEEALLKFVVNEAGNKAVMTLVDDASAGASYQLGFIKSQYTGSKLTYTEVTKDPQTGQPSVIDEIRDDYYTRYNFKCKLNLNTQDIESGFHLNREMHRSLLRMWLTDMETFISWTVRTAALPARQIPWTRRAIPPQRQAMLQSRCFMQW